MSSAQAVKSLLPRWPMKTGLKEEAKAPVGVVVKFRPWRPGIRSAPLEASQHHRREDKRVTVSEAAQQGQMGRQIARGIPSAVKRTVREWLPTQLYTTMPTTHYSSDLAQKVVFVWLRELEITSPDRNGTSPVICRVAQTLSWPFALRK